MIRYNIEELKLYYNKYDDEYVDEDYIENVDILEETLSNIIDSHYINNGIYHIFPILSGTTAVCFVGSFLIGVC